MALTDPLSRHYPALSGAERFVLWVESAARGDAVEGGRVDGTCPRLTYVMDDDAYRGRLDLSAKFALIACADIERDLACLRQLRVFADVTGVFREMPGEAAEAAFFAGVAYAQGRAGLIAALAEEGATGADGADGEPWLDADTARELEDAMAAAGEPLARVQRVLADVVGRELARRVLSAWEGLGRVCRAYMNVEPLTLTTAWGLLTEDPAAEARALCPTAEMDEAAAGEWADTFGRIWRQRFGED